MGARAYSVALISITAALGCGGDLGEDFPSETPVDVTLTVWNRSQFELLELRVHDGTDYDLVSSLLSTPLAIEAQADVPFTSLQRVTVFRRKVGVGDVIALTTSIGLPIFEEGYKLIVFDDSFRLLEPETELTAP
jgi:hypothetical protein